MKAGDQQTADSLLRWCSSEALIAELYRRFGDYKWESAIMPCDECEHFKFWKRPGEVPKDYNPCSRKHVMLFQMPREPQAELWGYYLPNCPDRDVLEVVVNSQGTKEPS